MKTSYQVPPWLSHLYDSLQFIKSPSTHIIVAFKPHNNLYG